MAQIEFLFDFGSPNAYLVHKVVPSIEARIGAPFVYKPILLGGLFKLAGSKPPMVAYKEAPSKLAYEGKEMERFQRDHGLTAFRFNPNFPVNTLHLMRGVFAARELGVFERYIDVAFAAMWEHGLKMDDPGIIKTTLDDAGLPADAIIAGSQDQAVKDELVAATSGAHRRGAFGSPTFFVGDEIFFGKERLPAIEAELLRQREAA